MNRENLKSILCLVCILLGVLCNFFTFLTTAPSSHTFILGLTFSFILYIFGGVSLFLHYRNLKIIGELKSNPQLLMAHWHYHPKDFDLVRLQLEDDRYVTYSTIILTGVCGFFICLGTCFVPTLYTLMASILWMIALLVGVLLCLWGVSKYYARKISSPHETLISENYIYFKGELYSLQRAFYFLEYVEIIHKEQYYLQFTYSAPGTPFGPFHILSIPIPEDELVAAEKIKIHFLSLAQETLHSK